MIVMWMLWSALIQLTQCVGQFQYAVRNDVFSPTFYHEKDMRMVDNNTLAYYMNRACDMYPETFTYYSATYFPTLGYFIDSINGLAGDWDTDKSYWNILNFSQPLSVGVSSYVPKPGDNIVFNFTIFEI